MNAQGPEQIVSSARRGLGRFLTWWKQGLVASMPGPLRAVLLPATQTLVLRLDGRDAKLELARNGQRELLGVVEPDTTTPPAILQALRQRGGRLEMLLPRGDMLHRELSWPLAAEANLRDALAYQLDRLTPLAADAAYFDYHVSRRDTANATLQLELAVVPRTAIDPWLARLKAEGVAGALRHIRVEGVEDRFDFLPTEIRQATVRGAPLRWKLYPVIFILLLIAALWLPLHAKHRLLDLVEQDIETTRGGAEVVTRLQQQTDRLVEAIDAVVESRRRAIPVLTELEELARLIPDSAYIQRLDYDGRVFTVTGEAQKSVEIVETLAASPLFADVEFSAPVKRNALSGNERFQLLITAREASP